MIKINDDLLLALTEKAKANPRKRMNHNFHYELDDPIQRFLNALEPDTFLPPHRHLNPSKEEIFLVLKGKLVLIEFDDEGKITSHMIIEPRNGTYGGEVSCGTWHTLISLESGTVIYEIKKGPFEPIAETDLAPWVPQNSLSESIRYQQSLLDILDID